jgi:Tfp pilus assembly protein PilO
MYSISEATKDIILKDEVALESLRKNILNLRAYARTIRNIVKKETFKDVSLDAIVISLSRIKKEMQKLPSLKPAVTIENLSIKTDLVVVTYEKSVEVDGLIIEFIKKNKSNDFFVMSEGITEITIAGQTHSIRDIVEEIAALPKSIFTGGVAITLTFDEKYVEIPNVLYGFTSELALKRVNLLQIVSNLTEVSFIVEERYMNDTIQIFQRFLRKNSGPGG